MFYMNQYLQRFVKDEKGQALTEYGLIIALVAVALIVVLGLLGTRLGFTFQDIVDQLPSS